MKYVPLFLLLTVMNSCGGDRTSSSTTFVPAIDAGMSVVAVVESSEARLTLTFVNDPPEIRGGYYEIFDSDLSKMYLANTDANDRCPPLIFSEMTQQLKFSIMGFKVQVQRNSSFQRCLAANILFAP